MNGAKGWAAGLLLLVGSLLGLVYLAFLAALLLAPTPGLEVFAVVCGALTLFIWFLGASLRGGGSRPFVLTPGRGLLRFLLALGLGALVMSAAQPLLTALLMPLLHVGAALLPALMAVGLAMGRRGRPGRASAVAQSVGYPDPHDADGTNGTQGIDAPASAAFLDDDDRPAHAVVSPEPSVSLESPVSLESSVTYPSYGSYGSHPSQPPQPSAPLTPPAPPRPTSQPSSDPVVTWQSVATGIAWGGCAATLLAMVVESVLALLLLVLVVALLGDSAVLGEMLEKLQPAAGAAPDPALQVELISSILDQPLFVLAAFMLMGALAPFTEELAKLLGPILAQRSELPQLDAAEARRRAWRRGVCAGAGFGAFEAIFYSAMVFSPLPWVAAVAVRACTTVMHAAFGGVAALGWRLGAVEGRTRMGLGLAAVAVLGHGLWNSLALGAMIASMQVGGGGEGPPVGALGSALALSLILLFYGLVAMFAGVTRWVNQDAPSA